MKPNNPAILSGDVLYRRPPDIPVENWTKWDEGTGRLRLSSSAVIFHDDGLSCYCRSTLWLNFMCYRAVKMTPGNTVFRVGVTEARELGFGVADDPNPDYIAEDESHPRDIAHVLVVHDEDLPRSQLDKRRSKLAKRSAIVDVGSVGVALEADSEPK